MPVAQKVPHPVLPAGTRSVTHVTGLTANGVAPGRLSPDTPRAPFDKLRAWPGRAGETGYTAGSAVRVLQLKDAIEN